MAREHVQPKTGFSFPPPSFSLKLLQNTLLFTEQGNSIKKKKKTLSYFLKFKRLNKSVSSGLIEF